MPKVSIICPVYNSERFLSRCINSIIDQSLCDWELILVDDGSSDNSSKICDEYSSLDSRILSYHKQNGGATSARKLGVEQSKGDWIMFVDSDDELPANSIQDLFHYVCPDYSIIEGCLECEETDYILKISGELTCNQFIKALLDGDIDTGPVAKLFRRELFEGINWNTNKAITNNEDLLMLLSLSSNINKVFIANDVICYHYIVRPNSARTIYMPLDKWILLFEEMWNRISSMASNETISSFCSYRINRLTWFILEKGNFIDSKNQYIKKLISETRICNLSARHRLMIVVFDNIFLQCLYISITISLKKIMKVQKKRNKNVHQPKLLP